MPTSNIDLSAMTIAATKPQGKIAHQLAEMGISIQPIEEDEGNVDRFLIDQDLAIECRTGSSFLKGIMEKTLFTSAIYLREHFSIPVLIVEGQINYEYSMMDPQATRVRLPPGFRNRGLRGEEEIFCLIPTINRSSVSRRASRRRKTLATVQLFADIVLEKDFNRRTER